MDLWQTSLGTVESMVAVGFSAFPPMSKELNNQKGECLVACFETVFQSI